MPEMKLQASRLEYCLAFLCLIYALSFSSFDLLRWHPGLGYPDECNEIQFLQEAREGQELPLALAKGCLTRFLHFAFGAFIAPSVFNCHLPVLLLFLLESWALYRLAERELGTRAALWAIMFNAIAASSLLRLRSLLSYAISPAELLLLMAFLPRREQIFGGLLWGFLAALCLLDYEGWMLGSLVLGLFVIWKLRRGEAAGTTIFVGWLMGAALVLLASWPQLSDYWAVRHAASLRLGPGGFLSNITSGLSGYFWGAPSLAYASVSAWPCFPYFALPLLVLGILLALKKERLWILLWILLAAIPLLSLNSAAETQRLIFAWPAFCLLTGLGVQSLIGSSSLILYLCMASLLPAAGVEAWAYTRSMNAAYPSVYGLSQELETAAAELRAQKAPLEILTHFDDSGLAPGLARFILDSEGIPSEKGGLCVALIGKEYATGLERQGRLESLAPSEADGALLLYYPKPAMQARLEELDAAIQILWKGLKPFGPLSEKAVYIGSALQSEDLDPWLRTVCYERLLGEALLRGIFPRDLVSHMENEELQSVAPLLWASSALRHGDPAWSERLEERAALLDAALRRGAL